jgi:predicted nucleic acid-binding protein
MIVVADSSPLVVLMNIGHVELLSSMYGRVIIPPEVAGELASPKRTEAVQLFIATPPAWLEIRPPAAIERIPGLDAGEAAAISLARELRADRVIIDEVSGRKAAAERNLHVIGTIGVLVAAAQRELVDLEQAFEMIKRTDFWVSSKFLDEQLVVFRKQKQEQDRAQLEQLAREQAAPEQEPSQEPEQKQDLKHGRGFGRGR